ncbi:methyltransferase domain-containing protein [Paenibacillus xerothermodurans]|nr:methyltransferase domain-containing protein [Paenibacillus xerothermodurans]
MACNVCDNNLHLLWLNGKIRHVKPKNEKCPSCTADPRFKTFRIIFDQKVIPGVVLPSGELKALVISGTQWEQDIIRKRYGTLVSAALYGRYGDNTVKTDLRDLKEFQDEEFDFVEACGVIDFIVEVDKVFGAVKRALKPGGQFLFHILDHRLTDSSKPPAVTGTKVEPYFPKGIELPSVQFGRQYLYNALGKAGFRAAQFEVRDIFSGETCTWYLGRK